MCRDGHVKGYANLNNAIGTHVHTLARCVGTCRYQLKASTTLATCCVIIRACPWPTMMVPVRAYH